MKDQTKKIIAGIATLAVLSGGGYIYDSMTISDIEIQEFIKHALINGCLPIIDIGDGSKEIEWSNTPEGCKENGVLRVSFERATDNMLELAKKEKVEGTLDELPVKIREKLGSKTKLQALKQEI